MRLFSSEKIIVVRKKNINVFALTVLTALLIVLFLNYMVKGYIPYIEMKCRTGANNMLNRIINEAVKKELENVTYDTLAKVTFDDGGRVKAVLCDTVKMSLLKHNISERITQALKKDNSFYITVPLVYISKNPLVSNVGPKVKVKVAPSGVLNVDFNDSFISAGINQTKHEINIVIKTGCYTYLSGIDESTSVTTTIPAVHTIIVGEVPETYTNVEGETGNIRDDVLNLQ